MTGTAAKSFYFNPRCLFCDKNNKRRHTKRGEHWVCVHCGERNPGPSMIRAMVARLTEEQSPGTAVPGAAKQTVDTTTRPTKAAATKIAGAAEAPPAKAAKVKAETTETPTPPRSAPEDQPAPATPSSKSKLKGLAGAFFG